LWKSNLKKMAGLMTKLMPILNSTSAELKALATLGITTPLVYLTLPASPVSTTTQFVHLSALAIQYGMHMWVSSVGGSTMFFNMPRHLFGRVQSKLFPKYFLISSTTSVIALGSYLLMHPFSNWDGDVKTKGVLLGTGLAGNLLNTFYFGPASTRIMWTCQAFEKSANHGHQVGVTKFDMSSLEPHQLNKYNAVRRQFGMLHGMSVLMNLGALVAHSLYFYYMAKLLAGVNPVVVEDLS